MANAKALAAWPDGNDVDRGIRICRASGTCSGSGRLRPPIGLSTAFTSADVAATDARPAPAARRPDGPRLTARIAAADSQRREWSAARDTVLIPRSRTGVGVAAIAA